MNIRENAAKKLLSRFAKKDTTATLRQHAIVNLTLLSLLFGSQMVHAQFDTKESGVLEEVVVTAQRREQSSMEVPIALTAFSGDTLREARIADVTDIILYTPGLSGFSSTSFTDTISLRGISTTDFGFGGDPSLAIYKDHVYQGRIGSSMSEFYDMERVEVLRGPQGLLFGRNAASGVIHAITVKPSMEEFEGYINVDAGERDVFGLEGALNIPLTDNLAMRISAYDSQEDGWVENVQGGNDRMGFDNKGARVSFAYTDEKLSVTIIGEYEERDGSGTIYAVLDEQGNDPLSGDVWTIDSEFKDKDTDQSDNTSFTLLVEYDLNFAVLSSITGYKSSDYLYREDTDGLPQAFSQFNQDQDDEYWSQEVRLLSTGEGPWSWFAGASWYAEEIDVLFAAEAQEDVFCGLLYGDLVATCEEVSSDPFVLGIPWPGYAPDGQLIEAGLVDGTYNGWAAYGELTYTFSSEWDISVGLRYSYDEKDFEIDIPAGNSALSPFLLFGYSTDSPVSKSENWDDLSPRVVVRYTPNDNNFFYASITNGYKAGGFDSFGIDVKNGLDPDTFAALPGAEPNAFDPETIWSYELGLKSVMAEGRVQLELSTYYYDYEDLQLASFVFPAFIVNNVGQVDGFGVESSLKVKASSFLDMYFNLTWSDTEAQDVNQNTCEEFSGNNCNGNRLPYQSEWQGAAVIRAYYPVGDGEIFATTEVAYRSDWDSDLNNAEVLNEPSTTQVNFRTGYRVNNSWTATLYVENVFDEQNYGGRFYDDFFSGLPVGISPNRPRTAGLEFFYSF
ncbi:MAG: iron complex outermembrane receptor protein [Halieaceae bacterium]|jgi:iron complex outermembrane receptor protein